MDAVKDFVRVDHLSCGYDGSVIAKVGSFSLERGELTVVFGPNGAGKTTLLKTLCALIPPVGGRVEVDGVDVSTMDERARATRISMLSQIQPLDPSLTVEELVALGRTPYLDRWGRAGKDDVRAVEEAVEMCALADMRGRLVGTLSGGERQRARLAMVVAQETPVVLLDEPTNHLDMFHRYRLHEILERVRGEREICALMVSHSLEDARRFGTRALLIHEGETEQFDDPEILSQKMKEISGLPEGWVY